MPKQTETGKRKLIDTGTANAMFVATAKDSSTNLMIRVALWARM